MSTPENPYRPPESNLDADPPVASPSPKATGPATKVRYVVFVLACMTSWFLYLHRYTWNVISPQLEQEYGFDNTELGWIFSAFNLSYSFGQIPSGIACDLFGPHLFLVAIIIAWSLALPLQGATGNIYGLGGIRLLFGASQAGAYPALGNVTRTWFPRKSRTIVQGFVASAFGRGGGAMASILMATVLMGYCGLGWRMALGVLGGAGVLFAVIWGALYRNSPQEDPRANQAEAELIAEGEPPDTGRKILPFGKAMVHRSLQVLVFSQFLNAGADIVYTLAMGNYFKSLGIEIKDPKFGVLVSLPLWGGAVGGVAGGILNDWLIQLTGSRRWGRTLVGFSGKTLAALALLFTITQQNVLVIGGCLFVVKFFSDWTQPTVWGTCTDLGGRYSATIFSINNTSGNIGALVFPLLNGPLLDAYTSIELVNGVEQKVTNFIPMFLLVAAMYLVNACCWFGIDSTKPIVTEEA